MTEDNNESKEGLNVVGDQEKKTTCCGGGEKKEADSSTGCCNSKKDDSKESCSSQGFCPITVAKSAISVDNIKNALLRAKEVMFSPKVTFSKVATENKSVNQIYKDFSAPLALISFVFYFIGMAVIGFNVPYMGTVRWPLFSGIIFTVVALVLHLLSLFLIAKVLQVIAKKFSGKEEVNASFALAAYVSTPVYFTYIISIIPALGVLSILFFVYSIYLVSLAAIEIVNINSGKKIVFTILTIVTYIVINLILGIISLAVNPVTPTFDSKKLQALSDMDNQEAGDIENSIKNIISHGINEIKKNGQETK